MNMGNDDDDAFRRAMRDVRPLRVAARAASPPRPAAVARFARAERDTILQENLALAADAGAPGTGDELSFRRPGVREDSVRRLRRGQVPVEAEIDLHGLRRHAAHEALRSFLAECVLGGLRCVRVIHGKGLRSGPEGPVLKHVVNHWLRKIENVAAFASARPADGGTGAVYVLLSPAPGKRPPTA
jgi:DNA-nicking Smr family endonuclease